jgi:hypothetical protein
MGMIMPGMSCAVAGAGKASTHALAANSNSGLNMFLRFGRRHALRTASRLVGQLMGVVARMVGLGAVVHRGHVVAALLAAIHALMALLTHFHVHLMHGRLGRGSRRSRRSRLGSGNGRRGDQHNHGQFS